MAKKSPANQGKGRKGSKNVFALAPNIKVEAFNRAEAAMREDDYHCYMLLAELRNRGFLAKLRQSLVKEAQRAGDDFDDIEAKFDEVEARLELREQHCEEMLRAVAGLTPRFPV